MPRCCGRAEEEALAADIIALVSVHQVKSGPKRTVASEGVLQCGYTGPAGCLCRNVFAVLCPLQTSGRLHQMAFAKALLENGVGDVGGYLGAPIPHLIENGR